MVRRKILDSYPFNHGTVKYGKQNRLAMVVAPSRGTPIQTPKYYSPQYAPQKKSSSTSRNP